MFQKKIYQLKKRYEEMNKKKLFLFSFVGIVLILLFFHYIFAVHSNHKTVAQNPKPTQNVVQLSAKAKAEALAKQKEAAILKEQQQFAQQKVVFLTFDDGPTPYTNQILDILKANHIHGTFFIVGNNIKGHEDVLKRIVDEGNAVGLHSMTHKTSILFSSPTAYINEFTEEQKLLASIGINTSISRTPYGSMPYLKQPYRDLVANAHLKLWDWTIDSNDWRYKSNIALTISSVEKQIRRQHEVVLMHDHQYTTNDLPAIIKLFKDRGYVFEAYNPDLNFSVNFWKDTRL